jgi:LuxR family maltose regulon positive regulatory protein
VPRPAVELTPRQLEVLHLLAAGFSTALIASELHVATDTVRNHVRAILQALGVHSRLQAVLRARELRLVDG